MSGETVKSIDVEIRKIIDENYEKATKILSDNMDILHAMSDALLKYETIDLGQIDRLMDRREPGEPADWGGDDSAGGASPKSDKPESKKASDSDEKSDDGEPDPADPSPSLH